MIQAETFKTAFHQDALNFKFDSYTLKPMDVSPLAH